METSNSVPCIPNDVILDIFCRLPVKSVARFSTVCKSWERILINSSEFLVKSHLEKSLKTNKSFPLLVYSKKSHQQSCNCRNPRIEIKKLKKISLVTGSLRLPDEYILAGCCNGLLCVYKNCNCVNFQKIYLWNPALHQCRALPNSKSLKKFTDLGFFFDRCNDDYKVVKIFIFQMVEIYSLKENSWRSIDLANTPMHPSYTKDFQIPVALDGILHWLVYHFNCSKHAPPYSVIKFNTAEEKFEEILLPRSIPLEFSILLGIYPDCLSLAYRMPKQGKEVWIMKEDQDKATSESWKIAVRKYSDGRIHYSNVKKFTNNREILADCRWDFVLYDSERGICEEFGLSSASASATSLEHCFEVEFVESLIPVWPGAKRVLYRCGKTKLKENL